MPQIIDPAVVEKDNERRTEALEADYAALGEQLARRGIDIDGIKRQVAAYGVAVPSWGVGTGGTRFARFPGRGEPRHIFDKLDDCAVIHQLARATPSVSLHIPWDKVADPMELRERAAALGLGFDAMNSNTFQDQPGQARSYSSARSRTPTPRRAGRRSSTISNASRSAGRWAPAR